MEFTNSHEVRFVFLTNQANEMSSRPSITACAFIATRVTLTFQIGVHIRLFIFRKKSPLYDLIRVYTFIRFEANPPYTIFIWYVRLLS